MLKNGGGKHKQNTSRIDASFADLASQPLSSQAFKMNIEVVNRIKRLAIIALASDDELIETLVLKGGNAIDLAYSEHKENVSRTSFDLDYSIDGGDFEGSPEVIGARIEKTLVQTFAENGYVVIDYRFIIRPKNVKPEVAEFWGGYAIEFKVIAQAAYDKMPSDLNTQRRGSIALRPDHSPKFQIELSKFEYIGENSKQPIDVDGYTVYVYTAEMIAFEKVRAICQQLPEYSEIIKSFSARARARDFYDIHLIMESYGVTIGSPASVGVLQNVFAAKKVPMAFLKGIRNNKSLHSNDWENVKTTISQSEKVKDFDFYFDYVVNAFEGVTPL